MKVLLLSGSRNDRNAGASGVYHNIADGLTARGHEVRSLHFEDYRVPSNRFIRKFIDKCYTPQFISGRISNAQALQYDVVMAPAGIAFPLFRRLRTYANRPLLVNQSHGLFLFNDLAELSENRAGTIRCSRVYLWLTRHIPTYWDYKAAEYADVNVMQNQRDAEYLHNAFCDTRAVRTAYPNVRPEILAASDSAPAIRDRPATSLMWFGSWLPRKGSAYVPSAFELVVQQEPRATLTVAGTGKASEDILREFHPNVRDRIRVLPPRMSTAEQIDEFGRHAIFLFPSLSEGFGLAIAEAMALGLAAVTTATGIGADHVRHGETGLVVEKSNPQAIADAAVKLMRNEQLRCRIALQGRQVARDFTLSSMIKTYEDIFTQQLGILRPTRPDAGRTQVDVAAPA